MASQFTYLAINAGVIAVPLLFSFEPRIRYVGHWKSVLAAAAIIAVPFLLWDIWFTRAGVWQFNPRYVTGMALAGLPVEEWMFFICIPFACMFLYVLVKQFSRQVLTEYLARRILLVAAAVLFVIALLHVRYLYTGVCCVLLAMALIVVYWQRLAPAPALVVAYAVHLIPFAVVNGLLTALPVVIYNDLENSGLRIGTIPAEDFAYSGLLLTGNVVLYEWMQNR
ncbi:MAG: lycopene cyclase domain-containing protein [Chitinophagales bacterium]|nr:lycopene cyclase domain-containing protein [Chitinophagales bacterium]